MKRSISHVLCLILVLAMVLSMAACGGTTPAATAAATTAATAAAASTAAATTEATTAAESTAPASPANIEPITLSMYVGDYWQSNYIDPSWTDPLAKELTKRTGVTLKVTVPSSDDDEGAMNVMIASGDMPDLIFRSWGASKDALEKGGYVKPLDDLIEQYGPNIKKYHSGTFGAWKNRSDGKIYSIGYWYFNKVVKPALNLQVTTLQMRYDILKEMGYAKLDRSKEGSMNSFITLKEYTDLLDQVKAKYPEMIPALVQPTGALEIFKRSTGAQVHNGYVWENSKATDYAASMNALWAMKEINNLYQKGYSKIDNTTTTDEARKALMADGKVFSVLGYANLISEVQGTLSKQNDEKRYAFFYLRKDEAVDNIYMNGAWGDSSAGIHINAKLDDAKTIRAMQFLDYCAGPEGSLLVCAGIEGPDFTKDPATGWYKPEAKIFAAYRVWEATEFKKRGVGGWLNILPNLAGVTEDGHCYDVNAEYAFTQDPWVLYNNADWEHFAYQMIVSPYLGIDTDSQADAADADSKIAAYRADRLTNIMLLKDPAAIEPELKKLQEQMAGDGLAVLEKAQTDNWLEIAKQKGRTPENINQTVAQSK